MDKLKGKVAVITGATSGMALATAKLFVEEGAHVGVLGQVIVEVRPVDMFKRRFAGAKRESIGAKK